MVTVLQRYVPTDWRTDNISVAVPRSAEHRAVKIP